MFKVKGMLNLRVAIMAVNIDCSLPGSRSIVPGSRGIVIDQWNDDTGVTSLVFNILHVHWIGEFNTAAATSVLIFGLIQDDRTAIGNLVLGNCCSDVRDVTVEKSAGAIGLPGEFHHTYL